MLAIYIILAVLLLILFILLTAIVLTFKFKVLNAEEKSELGGIFTVKWLFFSHTFLIGEPKEKQRLLEFPNKIGKGTVEEETGTVTEVEDQRGKKFSVSEQAEDRDEALLKAKHEAEIEKGKTPGEKKPEEEPIVIAGEEKIEVKEKPEEKRGILDRLRGKKRVSKEAVEEKKGMSTREKLDWGLKAYKELRKPVFNLFSDMLKAIKIKNLNADLTFGLSDPADTGMLCGFVHALLGTIYNRCRNCSFYVCPVFMEPLLDFRGSAEIRIKIYSLIFPFIKFMFNRKTLSFTYSIVKEKLRDSSKVNS
jgi:hypothetical protein